MAKKRKTLVDNFQSIIDGGDLDSFKAVFDKCEITATNRGKTTCNALSYQRLTPAHIQFLVDNGIDINADCGWGHSAVALQARDMDNLRCLLDNGADIDRVVVGYRGNALTHAASITDAVAVKNLLECGAAADIKVGWENLSVLDTALAHCQNGYIVEVLKISKMLLAKGVKPSDKTKEYVHRIGERFEFYRRDFNKDLVDEYSDALEELYKLFDVEPVPRRVMYDGKSKIVVKSTTWQKQHEELWNMLVPGRGAADTVQGEMIRIIGKVLYEILDNGGMNWDDEYRKMMKALTEYFHIADGIDAELVGEACSLIRRVSANSDKKELYRLNELAVQWVLTNPNPIKLGQIDYIR